MSIYWRGKRDMSIARVTERVRPGGRGIPEPVIQHRFASGLCNVRERYRQAVNDWASYNNTKIEPVMLEWGEN